MKKIMIGLVALTSISAFAGANNISVKCHSASGRTEVNAWIPGDNTEQSVKITVDKKTLSYINQEMVNVLALNNMDAATEYPGHQVNEISASLDKTKRIVVLAGNEGEKEPVLMLFVSNLKKINLGGGTYKGTFSGELSNTLDPRDPSKELPFITVGCTYSYSN